LRDDSATAFVTVRLLTFYRAAPVGGVKRRPEDFSKSRCLASFLKAAEHRPPDEVHFVCDGVLPEVITELMHERGHVHQLGGIGNTPSFRATLDLALERGAQGDALYIVEDDYLHNDRSLETLEAAMQCSTSPPRAYFTLYDHPDRYRRSDDAKLLGRSVELFGGRHWRWSESTTMTFASHVETLEADRWVFRLWSARWFRYPHDRAMWRSLQRLGRYRLLPGAPRRLHNVLPAEATHMELDMLAPTVDWRSVVGASVEAARALGIDESGW